MLKHEDLNGFIGTEHYYYHMIGNFSYTDGIQYLAEQGKCYWLLDLIGSYQADDKGKKIPFQLWKLRVNEDKTAVVTMQEDSDTPIIIEQKLSYTDFPLDQIKLYFIEGVLILPSEY
jgi:hypothetical protein